ADFGRRSLPATSPRRRKGETSRLRVRERRDPCGARSLRVRRYRQAQGLGMRRLGALLVLGARVEIVVAFVQGTPQRWFETVGYPLRYESIVRGHARNYHLDPALLAAVIYQESNFRPTARSSSGAVGLMQLMPSTAEGIAARTGGTKFKLDDLVDPEL